MSKNCITRVSCALLLSFFLSLNLTCAYAPPAQTDVNQAEHSIDTSGVPHLKIADVGVVDHPAWTALYALAYAGIEDYDPSLGITPDRARFETSIEWLKSHLAQNKDNLWIWPYQFDNTYNDITIKAPWSSAFAQAVGIQALLVHWHTTHDQTSLELAEKAAQSLFVPLSQGGFLFQHGDDVFFEEIPLPVENPSHILNGHMRTLLALDELHSATENPVYADWFHKGMETLLRWLLLYDAGYWLRYDLNPRKEELLFRLANPYGFANPELAIDRIVLRDPVSGEEAVLDVGAAADAKGALRIAGNDWGQIEQLDGRSVRRLLPVSAQHEQAGSEGQMVAPYSYFYLKLPARWQDNLRRERLELMVEYLDEAPGNLQVQMRSIAPGATTFRALHDGDLLLSGSGQWRQWRVPLYGRDLGFWVGKLYARKHADYLRALAQRDARLLPWVQAATAYLHAVESGDDFQVVVPEKIELPQQSPTLPIYSSDKNGVLMVHLPLPESRFDAEGMYDFSSSQGYPVYSPYIIANQQQIIDGLEPNNLYRGTKKTDFKNGSECAWLRNQKNQVEIGGAITYEFNFPNVYNDIVTPTPWPSAFSQAYTIKALNSKCKENGDSVYLDDLIRRLAYAYDISISQKGISSFDKSGMIYFEEVPNNTHVLNAHLISISELANTARKLDDERIRRLVTAGIDTLRAKLWQFDTGYWLRYDLNPKKELLFQLDWLSGETSPLIESIRLEAPQSAKMVVLDAGSEHAFDGVAHISGTEWLPNQQVDEKQVRAFANGYRLHPQAVAGGTRHNVYALMQLPERTFSDNFDIYPHRLVIRYKDVSAGRFVVKIQSIDEGNVLDFVPLRNAVILSVGDGQWKEAVVEVRSQDMGWYKGADYQIYEVEQLRNIAKLTGDWFFEQHAKRQGYFLQAKQSGESVIRQPVVDTHTADTFSFVKEKAGLSVVDSSPTYEGFGFENAMDGDLVSNYVAGIEGEGVAYVVLQSSKPLYDAEIRFNWESELNYPAKITVNIPKENGEWKEISEFKVENGAASSIHVSNMDGSEKIRIEFSDFKGQTRLLLRAINVISIYNAHGLFSDDDITFLQHLESVLKEKIFGRLKVYSETPLFSQMSQDDLYFGVEGNCAHTALWSAIEMDAEGVDFRVLAIKSKTESGHDIGHAMVEFKVGEKWVLTDPLNGWVYPKSFIEMKEAPALPLNDWWGGRPGHEMLREPFFFRNSYNVEAYEDLAYTGLFPPKKQDWRYFLIK